ncbi:MAG: LuxR C-terminal-related transcriptional regulator [Pseudomonadota bacterium]
MTEPHQHAASGRESLIERFAGRFPVHAMRRLRTPDGRFRYTFVSPAVENAFGLALKDLLEAEAVDHAWIHGDDRARFIAALNRSADRLQPLDEEVRVYAGDGIKWVRSLGDPVRLSDGTVVWDGVALDITDRREALSRVEQAMDVARAAEVAASATPANGPALVEAVDVLTEALSTKGTVDLQLAREACARLRTALGLPPSDEGEAPLPVALTTRQMEIVRLVKDGLSNREIAERLTLSEGTVKIHLAKIFRRAGVRNRTELSQKVAA